MAPLHSRYGETSAACSAINRIPQLYVTPIIRSLTANHMFREAGESTTTSFTLVNQSHTPIRAPASRSSLLATVNRSSVYDLQDDSDPDDHIPSDNDPASNPASQKYPIPDVSDQIVERDLSIGDEVQLQEPVSKRRKYPNQRWSRQQEPRTISSGVNLVQTPEYAADTSREYNKPSATQLTTPPESLKRRRRGRGTTLDLKSKVSHMSPFQNAATTKFSASKSKEAMQELSTPSLIQHKQITTTEQQLSLSKSTLEKLSAFRYRPQISNNVATIGPLSTDGQSKEPCQSPSYPACHKQSYLSSSNIPAYLAEDIEKSMNHFEHDIIPITPGQHLAADRTIKGKRSCDSVAVEPSYPDGYGIVSGHISRDMYTNDAFDEGLSDIELLEIDLEPEIPGTLHEETDDAGHRPQILNTPQSALHAHSNIQENHRLILKPNESQDGNITCEHFDTGIVSEADDPFCIGEEEEGELLKLAQVSQSAEILEVTERFVPSTSVQGAICTGSEGEVYDSALQFSPPNFQTQSGSPKLADSPYNNNYSKPSPKGITNLEPPPGPDEEDWSFIQSRQLGTLSSLPKGTLRSAHAPLSLKSIFPKKTGDQIPVRLNCSDPTILILDDRHEYERLQPFARPVFPSIIPDRSPVVGLSAHSFLRVCFRVGEMYKEGSRCNALGGDAIIELFARVGFSSREPGTIKQHFQFLDLWHDRPPIVTGILGNYKTTALAESESQVFLDGPGGKMARCLGRLKRDSKSNTGWVLNIINIRETDWEEISWTRRIVSGECSTTHKEDSDPEDVSLLP